MPSIEEIKAFTESDDWKKLVLTARPVMIQIRTVEGTKERLEAMVSRGFGKSVSEAAHFCLQIGLLSFEEQYDEEQEALSGDMGPVFSPGSKGDVGVGPEVPPGELDEDFPPDDAWSPPE